MTQYTPGPWVVGNEAPQVTSSTGKWIGDISTWPDARLIATAPELLTVLEWLHRKGGLGLDVHERLAAVIAKAKGK